MSLPEFNHRRRCFGGRAEIRISKSETETNSNHQKPKARKRLRAARRSAGAVQRPWRRRRAEKRLRAFPFAWPPSGGVEPSAARRMDGAGERRLRFGPSDFGFGDARSAEVVEEPGKLTSLSVFPAKRRIRG